MPFPILIPIIIIVASLAGTGAYMLSRPRKVKGASLAVLGMRDAGKTRFYRYLQGREYIQDIDEQTEKDEVEEFDLCLSNNHIIHIQKGHDYGGGRYFIKEYYEELVNKSDIVVFLFDIYKYFNDVEYQKETNSIAEIINRYNKKQSNIVKLATHLDYFKTDVRDKREIKKIKKDFNDKISDKKYWRILDFNFYIVDMTNKEQLKAIVDKIFEK